MAELSADERLFSDYVDRLLGGEKLCVVGLCCAGKTRLVNGVRERLEALSVSPIIVAPDASLDAIDASLATLPALVESSGFGVVLLDDFDLVLHYRADGLTVESRLNAYCVNGVHAKSVGVLMTARPHARLAAYGARGSPFDASLSLTRHVPPRDFGSRLEGAELEAFRKFGWFGYAPHLKLQDGGSRALQSLSLRLAADVSVEDFQALANIRERQVQGKAFAYSDRFDAMHPIVHRDPEGAQARIPSALLSTDLFELATGSPWPVRMETAARRLLARIGAAPEAYWVDKHLGASPDRLVALLDHLSDSLLRPLDLRLLTSRNAFEPNVAQLQAPVHAALTRWKTRGLTVSVRSMPPTDEVRLHDRQIAFERRVDGYEVPPFDRVVCKVPPGNTSDRYMPRVDVAYMLNAWRRATPIS